MAIQVSRAFRRYVQLAEELLRQQKLGQVSESRRKRFEDALETCRKGMTEAENTAIDFAANAGVTAMGRLEPKNFTVDASKPPYEVQCPVCNAYALGPCRSLPRPAQETRYGVRYGKWPHAAHVLPEPHPERQEFWERNPHKRSRAM